MTLGQFLTLWVGGMLVLAALIAGALRWDGSIKRRQNAHGVDVGLAIIEPARQLRAWWRERRDEDNGKRLIEGMAELRSIEPIPTTYRPPIAITYVGADPETIARAERAARVQDEITRLLTKREAEMYGPGRHAAIGLRDPRRAAIKAPTQAFVALVQAETGEPLLAVGPREVDLPTRTYQPPKPEQLALDLEVGGRG